MTWTKTRPNETGFYWVRSPKLKGPTIVEVYEAENELCAELPDRIMRARPMVADSGPTKLTNAVFREVEWAGPLRPP